MSVPVGDPRLPDRFWTKIDVVQKLPPPWTPCWMWNAAKGEYGHGFFHWNGRSSNAHRVAYQELVGPIPSELELDHLCRNPPCVNPAHLEPVTHRENMIRGKNPAATNAAKSFCDKGHEFTPENTIPNGKQGRGCLECRREYDREWKRAWRAANAEAYNAARREKYRRDREAAA